MKVVLQVEVMICEQNSGESNGVKLSFGKIADTGDTAIVVFMINCTISREINLKNFIRQKKMDNLQGSSFFFCGLCSKWGSESIGITFQIKKKPKR